MKCQGDEWKDLLAVAKRSNIGRGGILLQILRCSNRDLLRGRFSTRVRQYRQIRSFIMRNNH